MNSQTKVCIICPEHGEFWQEPAAHVRGYNCPVCSNKKRGKRTVTTESLIEKCSKKHNSKYTYGKTEYISADKKICVTCPVHGDFYILPFNHLGCQGCPKCKGKHLTQEEWIDRFNEVHNNKYDYSKAKYIDSKTKMCIICPEHGEFWQTPHKHVIGQGCPKCSYEKKFLSRDEFIEKSRELHGDKYTNGEIEYVNYKTRIKLVCPEHGEFWQLPTNHLQGCGCPKCGINLSRPEQKLYEYINEIIPTDVIQDSKDIIPPYELDIYVPDKKIAIEFDGLFWHNEIKKPDKSYHLNKTNKCNENGIRLIHIFEDEWQYKSDIVKSRLRNIFGISENKIYARKCVIREVDYRTSKSFLNKNHIQGNCVSSIRYGLYYNNELVSIMTFGKQRKNMGRNSEENCYELLRFCNVLDTIVVGGASKLLKHFIKVHKPFLITSYCDKRWSNGELYETLGFKYVKDTRPSYFYIINGKRENRFNYRKDVLIKKYNCPKDMSEHDFMLSKKKYRIYDCGNKLYEMRNAV